MVLESFYSPRIDIQHLVMETPGLLQGLCTLESLVCFMLFFKTIISFIRVISDEITSINPNVHCVFLFFFSRSLCCKNYIGIRFQNILCSVNISIRLVGIGYLVVRSLG